MADRPNLRAVSADLEKVRRHLRILVELGRLGGKHDDLARFLDAAVLQVARAVEIEHVKILQYRRKTSDFLVVAGVGWHEGVVGAATLSADVKSPPGHSFQTAEAVVIENFEAQTEYTLSDMLRDHGIVSLANAPIVIDGVAWGVLEVDSTVICEFSRDTTEFLVAAGALIGAVVRNYDSDVGERDRVAAATQRAQAQETLLREIQHRVKNNFQLILSSLTLQKRRYDDPNAHRALDHVISRINAISLAHDQLAIGQGGQVVNIAEYLRALCISIRNQVENIEIEVSTDEMELAIERAVPLGLIMNEAITNSVKHAFGPAGGGITVRLQAGLEYGQGRLAIADNGKGMNGKKNTGSGLKLIEAPAAQIGGTVTWESSSRGTSVSVLFSLAG